VGLVDRRPRKSREGSASTEPHPSSETLPAAGEALACVLIVSSLEARGRAEVAWLRGEPGTCYLAPHDRAEAVAMAAVHQPEVAIIELGFHDCDGPGIAVQVAAAAPQIQVVFFAERGNEGEVAAARALGFERVVLLEELPDVLPRLLAPLAELVRLRRRVEYVEELLREVPLSRGESSPCGRITLLEGERRYRETYVRTLLAETGNRRETARRAGVPYTTLCDMMRKLGINGEIEDRTELRTVR
jgi:DNA-binding NtrC family response regulator